MEKKQDQEHKENIRVILSVTAIHRETVQLLAAKGPLEFQALTNSNSTSDIPFFNPSDEEEAKRWAALTGSDLNGYGYSIDFAGDDGGR